ncbi:hypothetical protein [Haloarchaeobius litoreus]|uniref:Cox cluster protein n=1 Tax=Haloarchaeobius litoreus TaxID=755306 RepID=A0ABD6DMA9_9EURY|nr:hypothetical protein [Haloarchaeobius litoreus]
MSSDAESPEKGAGESGTPTIDGGTETADDDSEGYVHRPAEGTHPEAVDREWNWRGWVVVAVVAFSFLVMPVVILYRPPSLPYWVALLAFPMLPALLLGLVAVWGTTRP